MATALLLPLAAIAEPHGHLDLDRWEFWAAVIYNGALAGPAGTWAAVSVARALPPITGALGMLGVPLVGRQLERRGIDAGKQIPLNHALVVDHMHPGNASGNLRRQRYEVRLNIRVRRIGDDGRRELIQREDAKNRREGDADPP